MCGLGCPESGLLRSREIVWHDGAWCQVLIYILSVEDEAQWRWAEDVRKIPNRLYWLSVYINVGHSQGSSRIGTYSHHPRNLSNVQCSWHNRMTRSSCCHHRPRMPWWQCGTHYSVIQFVWDSPYSCAFYLLKHTILLCTSIQCLGDCWSQGLIV